MNHRLREVFTPLFSYVLVWLDSPSRREQSFGDLRREIRRLLEEQVEAIRRHEIPRADYDAALFAAIAWTDEVIVRRIHDDNLEIAQQWRRSPLQVELFNTANAGEEFYERLSSLPAGSTGVREVFYLCLSLGFRGRYYDDAHDGKLAEIRQQLGKTLSPAPDDLLALEKRAEHITPQPYDVGAPTRRSKRSLPIAYVVLPLMLMLAAGLYYLLPSGRSREAILADVHAVTANLTCAALSIESFDDAGVLGLSGRVPDEDVRRQLHREIKEIPEIKEIRDQLRLIPRPFCQVIEVLDPVRARDSERGARLSIRAQRGCDAVYRQGENLVFSIGSELPLGYVYADYFVADRQNVAHLAPSSAIPNNAYPNQKSVMIGGPDSELRWTVEPPFGMELITVIAAAKPLMDAGREVESTSSYLTKMQAALGESDVPIAAAYCFITTSE